MKNKCQFHAACGRQATTERFHSFLKRNVKVCYECAASNEYLKDAKQLRLIYKVEGQGVREVRVADLNEAQMEFAYHRSGRIETDDHNYIAFGASELLTTPTVVNPSGRVVAKINYNGTLVIPGDYKKA
jgi:hypothetical protein